MSNEPKDYHAWFFRWCIIEHPEVMHEFKKHMQEAVDEAKKFAEEYEEK